MDTADECLPLVSGVYCFWQLEQGSSSTLVNDIKCRISEWLLPCYINAGSGSFPASVLLIGVEHSQLAVGELDLVRTAWLSWVSSEMGNFQTGTCVCT